jgi:hypothetical protein
MLTIPSKAIASASKGYLINNLVKLVKEISGKGPTIFLTNSTINVPPLSPLIPKGLSIIFH